MEAHRWEALESVCPRGLTGEAQGFRCPCGIPGLCVQPEHCHRGTRARVSHMEPPPRAPCPGCAGHQVLKPFTSNWALNPCARTGTQPYLLYLETLCDSGKLGCPVSVRQG